MIFSPSAIEKIKAGQKTATTRKSTWFYKKTKAKLDAGLPVYDCIKLGRSKALGWIRITETSKIECRTPSLALKTLVDHAGMWYEEEGFDYTCDLVHRFLELKLDKALAKQGALYFYRFEYVGKEKPKA